MKRLILVLISLTVTISTFAQVDGTLSYQGYLTDDAGSPETGEHNFMFNFYIGSNAVADFSKGPIFIDVDKGLFTVTIGGGLEGHKAGTVNNDALSLDIWSANYEIGIAVNGASTDLARVPLTAVPYSFQSETANSLSGTLDVTQLSGTISNALLDDDLQDLADGSLSGTLVGSGINGANITDGTIPTAKISGTVAIADGGTNATTEADARTNLGLEIGANVQAFDANLVDLADGELTGSKVGSGISASNVTTGTLAGARVGTGISAANITTGTLPNARLDADLQALAGGVLDADNITTGTLAGARVGTGVSAANITTGTLPNARLDTDLQDLAADGSLSGTRVAPDFGAQDVTTTEGLHVGGTASPGTDNLDVDGFTQLGNSGVSVSASLPSGATASYPAIKVLVIDGTMAAANGTATVTLSGMTDANIISINVLCEYTTDDYIESNSALNGFQFYYYYQGSILIIQNINSQSASIAGRPFKATIIYTD